MISSAQPPQINPNFTSEPSKNQVIRHELKAPISAIRGYLSMLKDGDYGTINLTPEQKRVLEKIENDLEELSNKINVLLPD